jgi:RNA polymerase sigma-70 factor (ECF subfamily)
METVARTNTIPISKQELVNIYEQHSPGLYRYAFRLLGDQNLAEETVSETFSRLLQAIRYGKGPRENIQAYLYRVAHNYVMDLYRRQPSMISSVDAEEQFDEQLNPAHVVSKEMERERVRLALIKLPPDQRQVVSLRILDNWSHEEVAAVIGKTVEATRALQYRALAALRRLLFEPEDKTL